MSAALDQSTGLYLPSSVVDELVEVRAREMARDHAISFLPRNSFGTLGLGTQPSHERLLREVTGWAAIAGRAVVDRFASITPLVFSSRRTSDGTVVDEQLDDHVLKLMLDKPNPVFSRRNLQKLLAWHRLFVGEAYLQKVRDGAGVVRELWPMPPQSVQPISSDASVIGGYRVSDANGRQTILPLEDVVRWWNPDPLTLFSSMGNLGPQSISHDTLQYLGEHLRAHFKDDATPRVAIIGKDTKMESPDREAREAFYAEWRKGFNIRQGTNLGAPAFIPAGFDIKELSASGGMGELGSLDERKANQVLAAYGVPKSVIGMVEDVNRATAEAVEYGFLKGTIEPLWCEYADALTDQVAADFDPSLSVRPEDFVPADKVHKLAVEAQDLALKVRSVQQVLRDRGADPEDAPWGELPVGTLADQPYSGDEIEFEESVVDLGGDGSPPPGEASAGGSKSEKFDESEALSPSQVLNGAQVQAIVQLVTLVEADELGVASAKEIITVAFGLSPETATKILGRQLAPSSLAGPRGAQRSAHGDFSPDAAWVRLLAAEKKHRRKLEGRVSQVFATQLADILKRLKASEPRARVNVSDLFDPALWRDLWKTVVEPVRRGIFIDGAKVASDLLGFDFRLTDKIEENLAAVGADMVQKIDSTTRDVIRKELAKGAAGGESTDQIAKRLRGELINRRRSRTIARTEVLKANQAGQIESFDQSDVVERKQWNTSRDGVVRDSHTIDAQVADLRGQFVLNSGRQASHPGDPSLPAADVINCRCFVTPVLET